MSETAETVDPLLGRIDRLTELLELALSPQLEARRSQLRADPVDTAIFDATAGDWIAATELQRRVKKATGVEKRALQSHLSKLIAAGHVEHRGGRRYAEYRSSGLI